MYRSPEERLERFTRGFLSTLAELGGDQEQEGERSFEPEDLAPQVREALAKQCARFISENLDDLLFATEQDYDWDLAGHDFALSRNGHGAGFFDRDFDGRQDNLQQAAEQAGQIELYLGDDGQVHAYGLEDYTPPAPDTAPRRRTP